MNRRQALELFEAELRKDLDLMARLGELEGQSLACHCAKAQLCHADVLVRLFDGFKQAAISKFTGPPRTTKP